VSEVAILLLQLSKRVSLQISIAADSMTVAQPPFQVCQIFLPPSPTSPLVISNAFLFGFGSWRGRPTLGRCHIGRVHSLWFGDFGENFTAGASDEPSEEDIDLILK
jgi:hypothetical protein